MNIRIKNLNKSKGQIFLIVAIFSFLIFLPIQNAWASEITADNIIQLVNKERIAQGLKTVVESPVLSQAAKDKLNDMIENDYFAHTSPGGITPWRWIENSGYDYKYAGENLAINFTSAESQHKAWMESETHRKNILNPDYQEIGVAVAKGAIDDHTSVITVQFFGTQMSGIFQPTSAEKPAQAVVGERSVQGEPEAAIPAYQPLLSDVSLKDIQLRNGGEGKLACENGLCYFNQSSGLLYGAGSKIPEEAAWSAVVVILFLSIIINAAVLSREDNHNPFVAANTVVLLIILTSVVFWRI